MGIIVYYIFIKENWIGWCISLCSSLSPLSAVIRSYCFCLCTPIQLFLCDAPFAWINRIICITAFLLIFHGLTVADSVWKVF